MLTVLRGGHVVDPATKRDARGDVWFEDGAIVAAPKDGRKADREIDVSGHVVMAGAIDIHSHIAGGNVNTARRLPDLLRAIRAVRSRISVVKLDRSRLMGLRDSVQI